MVLESKRTQKEDTGPQCRGGDAVTSYPSWSTTVYRVDIRLCVFDVCMHVCITCMWSIREKRRIGYFIRQVKL